MNFIELTTAGAHPRKIAIRIDHINIIVPTPARQSTTIYMMNVEEQIIVAESYDHIMNTLLNKTKSPNKVSLITPITPFKDSTPPKNLQ